MKILEYTDFLKWGASSRWSSSLYCPCADFGPTDYQDDAPQCIFSGIFSIGSFSPCFFPSRTFLLDTDWLHKISRQEINDMRGPSLSLIGQQVLRSDWLANRWPLYLHNEWFSIMYIMMIHHGSIDSSSLGRTQAFTDRPNPNSTQQV